MTYIIMLLGFGAAFILSLELIPEKMNFFNSRAENGDSFHLGWWIIYKIANINKKLKIDNFRNNVRKKLTAAGRPFGWDPDEFLATKELSAAGFLLIFLLASKNFPLSAVATIAGFLLPDLWLNESIIRRKRRMVKELPYFVDMLTFSVEAGLDFGAAMNKIIHKSPQTPLIEELRQVQEEIKVGRTREDALHNLARRVDITEVSSFASALIQADKMGFSLGNTLRTQSEQMRLSRFLRAEKIAHEAPVKILFPLIIFIFPVIFIVLFGPVILQLLSY